MALSDTNEDYRKLLVMFDSLLLAAPCTRLLYFLDGVSSIRSVRIEEG
jgi:hypothetical protein